MRKSQEVKIERRIAYFIMTMPDFKYGKDMRLFDLSDWFYKKYEKQEDQTLTGYGRVFRKRSRNAIATTVVNTVQSICIYIWLIYKTFLGRFTIGEFTMFFSSITNFSSNIIQLFSNAVRISSMEKGLEDYLAFMDIEHEDKDGEQEKKVYLECSDFYAHPYIEFRDVWFRYPNQTDYAVKNMSLRIPYGQKISVVGENGAGKTTFVKLLTRLYEPTKGQILINNIDIRYLPLNNYRKMLSAVFQDFSTFAFTIKENITLAKEEGADTDQKVNNAIAQVGLKDKLDALPKGIHTYIGTVFDSDGIQLSGGQFQRLALARAIYRDASVLILDEPTAALDPRAEYEIFQKFYEISQNKTTFFISHRLANSRVCDRVIVFENGWVVEDGSHSELLSKGGLYSELYNMQKQYYDEDEENVEL